MFVRTKDGAIETRGIGEEGVVGVGEVWGGV